MPSSSTLIAAVFACLLLACDAQEPAGAPSSAVERVPEGTLHFLSFSRLQGYAEGVPCSDAEPAPLPAIALLKQRLEAQGDTARIVCIGDTIVQSATITTNWPAQAGARARGDVILDAMATAGVDFYVPGHGDFIHGVSSLLDRAAERGLTVLASNLDVAGRDDVQDSVIVRAGALNVACLAVVAPQTRGETLEDARDEGVTITKPIRRVRTLSQKIMSSGEVDMVVVFSSLSQTMNASLGEAPNVHFIIGGSDAGLQADRIVRNPTGSSMMYQRVAGREVGHTTIHVEDGNLAMEDISPRHTLPRKLERDRLALESYTLRYGTSDPDELAAHVAPNNQEDFKRLLEVSEEEEAYLEIITNPQGSYIEHHAAELPALSPDDPVMQVLAGQGPAIDAAMERVKIDIPPIDPLSNIPHPDTCRSCHQDQYEFWASTAHSRSFELLREGQRQQDSACLVCHVVGYGQAGGGFRDPRAGAPFGSITCHNCHLVRPQHYATPRAVVDPAFVTAGLDGIRDRCQSCHSSRRSPGFDLETALPRMSCPDMRDDEPAIVAARREVLEAVRRQREAGRDSLYDDFVEARALVGLGRKDEGLAVLSQVAAANTNEPDSALAFSYYFERHGRSQDAARILTDFLVHQPGDPVVNYAYLRHLLTAQDPAARDPELVLSRLELLIPEQTPQEGKYLRYWLLRVDALFAAGYEEEGFHLMTTLRLKFPGDERVQTYEDTYLGGG